MASDNVCLRLHAMAARTRANGPGLRTTIWVQGCTLGCPGCCNPATHTRAGGFVREVGELAAEIGANPDIEGVTLSGGEPFEQSRGVLALLERLRARPTLSVLLFSGYTRAEIEAQPLGPRILALTDVLVDGRYDHHQPAAGGLRASANQRVWLLSDRYPEPDIAAVPVAEILVRPDGGMVLTGITAPAWPRQAIRN